MDVPWSVLFAHRTRGVNRHRQKGTDRQEQIYGQVFRFFARAQRDELP